MVEEEKKVFDAEYEEIVKEVVEPKLTFAKPKPKTKPKPKPKVEEKPKVNLKDTLKLCDELYELVFTMAGGGRWSKARGVLANIRRDIDNKIKE